MADLIQLLPENVANQIAAGEVVQRPSSVVKELLENAVDAGASSLKLVVRDAGKTLIQVIDNGCGMSETDARMSFERHATSKIRDAKDLFAIRTMGFRGEALASIAAVAQVELRTRRQKDELGTRIVIEDSIVKTQEPCQCPAGTNLAVKNLFFNVPARRNFLKNDPVEMRHVMDEFQRIAMANPDLFFSLQHNDQELYHLPVGNLRQRIVKIFGEAVNKKLVPVQQETDILRINGFVGKPDYFKRARGEQMFFVNKRYIKSPYLHQAVVSAFEALLPADTFPLYVLFLEIDPIRIDINVHPTKQEIKFDDEKLIFNYLKVAVKHALGSHNVTPTLDFDQEPAFQARPVDVPPISGRSNENDPKSSGGNYGGGYSKGLPPRHDERRQRENLENWQSLFEVLGNQPSSEPPFAVRAEPDAADFEPSAPIGGGEVLTMDDNQGGFSKGQKEPYQIHGQYIVSQIKSGFLLIDQQSASERILYERYLAALGSEPMPIQKILFPKQIDLSPVDAATLRQILPEIQQLGFEVDEFGGNSFVIHGAPADIGSQGREELLLERLIAQYSDNMALELDIHDNLARSMAKSAALRRGQTLSILEMGELIDQLFACSIPYVSPSGRFCFITYELDALQKQFANGN